MMAAGCIRSKTLTDLIDDQMLAAPLNPARAKIAVNGLQLDSRLVTAGDVFLACQGQQQDGRAFIAEAIAHGAVAVLVESHDGSLPAVKRQPGQSAIPLIAIPSLTAHISEIAGRFYDHPSRKIPLVGITGTNGKTSCAHLLMQVHNLLGSSCGVIGTLGAGVDGDFKAGINTTPDAINLQKTLGEWGLSGTQHAVMEVSSHGLEQGRVAALQFEQAVFTNLTRDHLDYHGSMEAYGAAKARLFAQRGLRRAIINADDGFSQSLLASLPGAVEVITYGLSARNDQRGAAHLWVEDVHFHAAGVHARLKSPWGDYELQSPLLGRFNLLNVLAVVAAAVGAGYGIERVLDALSSLRTVAGRMERMPTALDLCAVVDYAHTPDALEQALMALRRHTRGKLWCVFGCGGDRDQGKRPQMGELAERYADHVVVTSDNPRHERPGDIIDQILGGIDRPTLVEEDRASAIAFAVREAGAGDSILVAGKGHEDYQQVGSDRLPFSDVKQLRLALAEREAREAKS